MNGRTVDHVSDHIRAAIGDGTLIGAGSTLPLWLPAIDSALHWAVGWAIAICMLAAAVLRLRILWGEDQARRGRRRRKGDVDH